MGNVKQDIFKIARELARDDAKNGGAGNWGWENIEDVAQLKMNENFTEYLAIATLEYLDGYRVKESN